MKVSPGYFQFLLRELKLSDMFIIDTGFAAVGQPKRQLLKKLLEKGKKTKNKKQQQQKTPDPFQTFHRILAIQINLNMDLKYHLNYTPLFWGSLTLFSGFKTCHLTLTSCD